MTVQCCSSPIGTCRHRRTSIWCRWWARSASVLSGLWLLTFSFSVDFRYRDRRLVAPPAWPSSWDCLSPIPRLAILLPSFERPASRPSSLSSRSWITFSICPRGAWGGSPSPSALWSVFCCPRRCRHRDRLDYPLKPFGSVKRVCEGPIKSTIGVSARATSLSAASSAETTASLRDLKAWHRSMSAM